MPKFRKKPVEIEAILWSGGKYDCLIDFCGENWGRADAKDVAWCGIADREEVVVYNSVERQWLCVPVGWFIIRGVRGELYPCKQEIFAETYEPAHAG